MPKEKHRKKSNKPYHKDKTLELSDTSASEDEVNLVEQKLNNEVKSNTSIHNSTFRSIKDENNDPQSERPVSLDLNADSPKWSSQDAAMPSQTQGSQPDEREFVSWEDRIENDPAKEQKDFFNKEEECTCVWGEKPHPPPPHICSNHPCTRCKLGEYPLHIKHASDCRCKCRYCTNKQHNDPLENSDEEIEDEDNPFLNKNEEEQVKDEPFLNKKEEKQDKSAPYKSPGWICTEEKDCTCNWCTSNDIDWDKVSEDPMHQDNNGTGNEASPQRKKKKADLPFQDELKLSELKPIIGRRITVITDTHTYIEGQLSEVVMTEEQGYYITLSDVTYDNKPIDSYTVRMAEIESIKLSSQDTELIEKIKSAINQELSVDTHNNEEFIYGTLTTFNEGLHANIILKEVTHYDGRKRHSLDQMKIHIRDITYVWKEGEEFTKKKKTPERGRTPLPTSQEVEDLINLSTRSTGNKTQGTRTDDQEDFMESETKDPYSRPQTAMSEAMRGEQMEDSWERLRNENFLNTPPEDNTETTPISDSNSAEATQEESDKTKDFVKEMKERVSNLQKNFGLNLDRDELMKSILLACNKADIGQNDGQVRRLKIPLDYDLKSTSSLAALYRYICTHATDSPRRHWATLMQEGFTDPALFEESKVKWHKSLQELIRANKMERQITPEVLADLVRQAAKANNIKFSKSMAKLTVKEVPEGLPTVKSLNHIWFKLSTDPLSKIPLTWNEAMKKAYQRDTYPPRGFYVQGIHQDPDETDRKRATNAYVDSLATGGTATKVPRNKVRDEMDWLSRAHANAKAFRQEIDDRTWRKIHPLYTKWVSGYPTEQFSTMIYRLFPHLRGTTLNKTMDVSEVSVFNKAEPPSSNDEWMKLFSTKTVNIPGTVQLQSELHILQGNWNNIINLTALKALKPEDFRRNGRYAHIYIGRQNRLPAEAYRAINILPPDNPDLNQLVWRHFYKARSEAAKNYKANISDEDLKISPWLRLLCDESIPKTFYYDDIDKVQCLSAHKLMSKHNEDFYGPDCMYHNFVRPLERLFTVDMPLSKQLAQALKYKDATDDLGHFVMKLVGWDRFPGKFTAQSMVEELSKIRTAYSSQLSCANPLDTPFQLQRKIELKDSRNQRYVNTTNRYHEGNKKTLVNYNPFQIPSTEEMDERIEENMTEIVNALQHFENYNSLNEQQRYQLLHIQDCELRAEAYKENDAVINELNKIKHNLTVLWDDYKRFTERRWETTYANIEVDTQQRENLEADSTHNLRLKLAREQADIKRLGLEYTQLKRGFKLAMTTKFNRFSKHEANQILSMLEPIQKTDQQIHMARATEKVINQILTERVKPTPQISNPDMWDPSTEPPRQMKTPEPNLTEQVRKKLIPTQKALTRMYKQLNGPDQRNLNSTLKGPEDEKSSPYQRARTQLQEMRRESNHQQQQYRFPSAPNSTTPSVTYSRPTSRQSMTDQESKGAIPKRNLEKSQSSYDLDNMNWPAINNGWPRTPRQDRFEASKEENVFYEGSWAAANTQHRFENFTTYWPHATNKVIPKWAHKKISAKRLNEEVHHMTLGALRTLTDTPDLIILPMNTGHYYTTIEMTKMVRSNNFPLGLIITEKTTDRQTKIGWNDIHSVHIPYNFLTMMEMTVHRIHEAEFPPLREEKESLAKILFASKEEDRFWSINTAVLPESTNKVWFRSIRFEVHNKIKNIKQRVKIPWIHMSMFIFYLNKIIRELDHHAYAYDQEHGPEATMNVYRHHQLSTIPR